MQLSYIVYILILIFCLVVLYELIYLKKEARKLMAITDKVTLLYNKKYFLERLSNELKRSDRYGIPISLILMFLIDANKVKGMGEKEYET